MFELNQTLQREHIIHFRVRSVKIDDGQRQKRDVKTDTKLHGYGLRYMDMD